MLGRESVGGRREVEGEEAVLFPPFVSRPDDALGPRKWRVPGGTVWDLACLPVSSLGWG